MEVLCICTAQETARRRRSNPFTSHFLNLPSPISRTNPLSTRSNPLCTLEEDMTLRGNRRRGQRFPLSSSFSSFSPRPNLSPSSIPWQSYSAFHPIPSAPVNAEVVDQLPAIGLLSLSQRNSSPLFPPQTTISLLHSFPLRPAQTPQVPQK